ncbi:Similar to hypothetical protein [Tuber melanosporum Mel28]; acc. no. XP_002842042 [Pyronema omphalodes CBS 100304]|uniref:Uncharacterized protein n=1 Tax=Pyronema omphalodes (strain CBS 100304) TaxID=1076935 RepID=U4LWC9_PYROM|nr:Similar to hypothetical protein [Tuber melanosporum Mel28]; acc. no. XP_002842042 [Pyronema omphalodes CBS 100304]
MSTQPVNTAMYVYTLRCAVALHTAFFRGVQQGPASYISLGQEIDRLSRAIDHLTSELHNPDSKLLRRDNGHTVGEALGIALDGAHATLVEIENTLVGLQVSRHNTMRWMEFAIKVQFHSGEERLIELKERVGYHCWALDRVLRTVMKNDVQEVLDLTQATSAIAHLQRLLYEQLDGLDNDPIIRRFEELSIYRGKHLFADYRADAVIRIVMYWSFKAITNLRFFPETKNISPKGYLNLLKAAWLFHRIRITPTVVPRCDETKAVLALVSTELLFIFKAVIKEGIYPTWDLIKRHGDFTVFPLHFAEQSITMPTSETDHQVMLEQEILDKLSEVNVSGNRRTIMTSSSGYSSSLTHGTGTSILPPPPPPPPYTERVASTSSPPSSPLPSLPPPEVPVRSPERKKRRRESLRVDTHRENERDFVSISKALQNQPTSNFKNLTPCCSVYTHADTSVSAISRSTIRTNLPRQSEYDELQRSPSPTPSDVINELYGEDSPTLGLGEYGEAPVKIEPYSPPPIPISTPTSSSSSYVAISSIELSPRQQKDLYYPTSVMSSRSSVVTRSSGRSGSTYSTEEKIVITKPDSIISDRAIKRLSGTQTYDPRAPSPNGLIVDDDREWNVDCVVEYGVQPGEREVMPEQFGIMRLKVSEICSALAKWQDCIIRIFENQATGEYRLITLRGNTIDQRFLPLATTELVPEYGYHENLPVIFLRKAGPGLYSIPPTPGGKAGKISRKSSISSSNQSPPPPATLYYKFRNLEDMFTFQQAFLRESVEADVQNIRTIRYTRGFLSSEHSTHKARIQLWKSPVTELSGSSSSAHRASVVVGRTPSILRTIAPKEETIIKPTRLILFLDEITINIFVTDDLIHVIPLSSPRTLRIRPSSYKTFNNPTSVKACVLGDARKDISGGFRLDKEGLGIDKQDGFEDFKWFEIDFQTEAECRAFSQDFSEALQQRRRERVMIQDLQKKAVRGVRMGEW